MKKYAYDLHEGNSFLIHLFKYKSIGIFKFQLFNTIFTLIIAEMFTVLVSENY